MMLEQILNHIHNYFVKSVHKGNFSIVNGTIQLDFMKDGQYFKIVGSDLNDGVFQYPISNLTDEDFTGEIWAMAVPNAVIALASEIENWNSKNQSTLGYTSESFGGYSYSKGARSVNGAPIGWEDIFRDRLNAWRKIS